MTPYIHIFSNHIWWFYKETAGDLNLYNMEGSEKFNDLMKHHYNRNSNKKNIPKSLYQIIQKQNRCELKRPTASGGQQSKSKYLGLLRLVEFRLFSRKSSRRNRVENRLYIGGIVV